MEGPGGLRVQLLSYAFSRKARITTSKGGFGLPFSVFWSKTALRCVGFQGWYAVRPQFTVAIRLRACEKCLFSICRFELLELLFLQWQGMLHRFADEKERLLQISKASYVTQGITPLRVTVSFGENECRVRDGLGGNYATFDCDFNFSNSCH